MNSPSDDSELQVRVDPKSCRLFIRTAAGPARLVVVDCNGKQLDVENVEWRVTDAVIDAVLGVITPEQAPPRSQAM